MPSIELAWDSDCPNVEEARHNLSLALDQLKGQLEVPPSWREWRRDDPEAPDHARRAGSPAILIDGKDVEGHENAGASCCRVYVDQAGKRTGAPSVEAIVSALRRAAREGSRPARAQRDSA